MAHSTFGIIIGKNAPDVRRGILFYNRYMLFCLYGPDSYRRKEKLMELIAPYKRKYTNTDILEVDIEDDEDAWGKVRDFLSQPSMFVDSKIAIIKNGTHVEDAGWIGVLRSQLKTEKSFVFLSEEKKPEGDFGFLLTKGVQSIEFRELSGDALKKFVVEVSKKHNISFERDALDFFCSFIFSQESHRSWRTVSELEKLSLLGLSQPIQKQELAKCIKVRAHEELFSVARALMNARNVPARLSALEKVFIQNETAAYFFNLLSSFARGSEIVSLADYDIMVKSGKLGYEEAILDFVLNPAPFHGSHQFR